MFNIKKPANVENFSLSHFGCIVLSASLPSRKNSLGMFFSRGLTILGDHIRRVVLGGSKKQMVWVATRRIIAMVADKKLIRHSSMFVEVGQPVSGEVFSIKRCDSVSTAIHGSIPQPASTFTKGFNQLFAELFVTLFGSSHIQEASRHSGSETRKQIAATRTAGGNFSDFAFKAVSRLERAYAF